MRRKPRYGELQAATNREAYAIWRERQAEPAPEDEGELALWEPVLLAQAHTEDADPLFSAVVSRLSVHLTDSERDVLGRRFVLGETLEEVAQTRQVTRERIREIEQKALRRLRGILGVPGHLLLKVEPEVNEIWRSFVKQEARP